MPHELGIIGAGNMAEAIVRGILRSRRLAANQIVATDPSPQRQALFRDELGVSLATDAAAVASSSATLLLSVKPQQMAGVLATIAEKQSAWSSPAALPLVLSIAAGVNSATIEKGLGASLPWRVVRAMPNTPMLIGQGMCAISRGQHATPADIATARRLFESCAAVIEVDEGKMNAVTAVSGSGPAYIFYLVEQMIRAGVEVGLSENESRMLAIRTAAGAASMLEVNADGSATDASPAELRRRVTSPGGTTEAAIKHMEASGLDRIVIDAIAKAEKRGRELGG